MKSIKRLFMLLITIMLILGSISAIFAANGRQNYDRNYHYVKYDIPQRITAGAQLIIAQYPNATNNGMTGTHISTLSQPHIYCVENGAAVVGKPYYRVSQEYTVEDPILAYILNHGPAMGELEQDYKSEPSQVALWHYLYKYSNDASKIDRIRMVGNKGQKKPIINPNSLYNRAEEYAKNINSNPTLVLEKDGNNVTINVNGNFEKFRISINDKEYAVRTKNISTPYSETIDVSNYNTEFLNIKIDAYKTKYSATYHVLTHVEDKYQRMIAVKTLSSSEQITGSITKKIEIEKPNVSLQKYITKVNDTEVETPRNNRKAEEGAISKINWNTLNSTGTVKINDTVKIEPGDYVTYDIVVYNNDDNFTVKKIEIEDILPEGVTKYSVEDGPYIDVSPTTNNSFKQYIYNLGPKTSSDPISVTVYFGSYQEGKLVNKAKITNPNPANEDGYRIEDSDYVEMQKYSVSLEKYITQITGKNVVNDENSDEDIRSSYYDIINYLSENNMTIDNLVEKWKNKSINYNEKYDLNDDKKIDNEDLLIYNKCKDITVDNIQSYINTDLNDDGHVDSIDLNIYKVIKTNLEKDIELNDYDRYKFILKSMYDNNISSNDAINYLYVKRLLLKTEKNKEGLKTDIDSYLKSDINDDGYVNSEDNYKVQDNKVIFVEQEYNLEENKLKDREKEYDLKINENINNLSYNDINILKNYIAKYDFNNDNIVDNKDIELLDAYKNKNTEGTKYYCLNNRSYEEIIELEKELKNITTITEEEIVVAYDYTDDKKLYFDDCSSAIILGYDENIVINEMLRVEINDSRFKTELDLNWDNVIDYTDYEILATYINIIKFIHNNVQDQDKINNLKQVFIAESTIFANDRKYNMAYDVNGDYKIDFADYETAKEQNKEEICIGINNLVNIDISFDLNTDGEANYFDYEFLSQYYIENIEDVNIDNIISETMNLINNYSVFDIDSENPNLNIEDLNVIKVYKGWKEYNENYNTTSFVEYNLYDINEDGLINEQDKILIENTQQQNELLNQLTTEEIDIFINYLREHYNNLNEVILDDIADTYLEIIANIEIKDKKDICVTDILENELYLEKTTKVSYADIENSINIALDNLDINHDGNANDDDIEFLNNHKEEVNQLASFDETIITNNDINGDGCVDQSDVDFYEKLIQIRDNSAIKNAITNNSSSTPSGDGSVSGRENHPIYNENGYSKENNKVRLEVGDTVTYTIKLTNTGKNTIKVTEVIDTFDDNDSADLTYIEGTAKGYGTQSITSESGKLTIKISNAPEIQPGESKYFALQFKVNVPKENTRVEQVLKNTAEVTNIQNKNDIDVLDSHEEDSDGDGKWNNIDSDWVKTHIYKVSLEKYVAKVNGKTTESNRAGKAEHKYDDDTSTKDSAKANDVVTVQNGDKVTYTIKVKNDSSNTGVYITEITDYLPNGVKYNNKEYTGKEYDITKETDNAIKFTTLKDKYLRPGEFASFEVTVEVIESNMSVNILRNVAEITDMKNKNDDEIEDSTQNNNKDADYIQMKDIIISGTVWNDLALNKTQDNYNGLYESEDEKGLSEIEVKLYRVSDSKVIKTETTDNNGYYKFQLDYIKGPKEANTNRWNGNYYSYYIVFEYDGITYTSTPDGKTCQDINSSSYKIDSNAREDNNLGQNIGVKSREDFNNSFSTINNTKGIGYTTKNENGYIPQSNHVYNSSMDMQSSTDLINIGAYTEDELKYIGLGLRGRDIFDLELISSVDQIKITVNNEQGVYKDTNTVQFRQSDSLVSGIAKEDTKTAVSEKTNTYINDEKQELRESDYNVDTSKYAKEQGISHVEVRYKITVQNTSITKGTATKITNYYDSKYTFVGAYATEGDAENYIKELTSNNVTGDKYGYVTIDTPSNMLNQSDIMEIYVVYTLNNPSDNLNNIDKNNPFVTLNMAEITEYKTECGSAQTEYTRGLIDKDSAPGSVNREQVRLTTTEGQNTVTTNGKPTTVEYYFNKLTNENIKNEDYLKILKYEDDTYATPTIFVAAIDDNGTPDNPDDDTFIKRAITGTVFEDYTTIIGDENEDIRVKTGDGVQDTTDNIEPGIKGITVKLYEGEVSDSTLRFTTTTNANGEYTFEGYLPGNYIVKYEYGDTNATFLLNNDPNTKSYNGEDFQSTNNTGEAGGNEYDWIKTLNNEPDYWYVYNENDGISTATDVVNTRQTVSTNVINFTDSQMTVLNNARDGMSEKDAKVDDITVESIRNATQMEALTNTMKLTMEKSILDGNEVKQYKSFGDYVVENMNFGIAEVPVTTIDLQKHVHSFTITDSTGSNVLAGAKVDTDNTSVVVNASKIAVNRLETVINVLSENLGISKEKIRKTINYDQNKLQDINITVAQNVSEENKTKLKNDMTKYSLAREIKILYGWKVTAGNVIAAPGTHVLDVSIEDEKLQGAKLEITYEISANIYAEKNFNNEAVTVPTIEGMVDYIDNDLSYDENKNTLEGNNSKYWSVTTYESVQQLFEGQGDGTLDPEGKKYSTIVAANRGSKILQEKCGEGTVYITLEKVLSSTDSTLADVILNSVDSYEYSNTIEITKLNYENQTGSGGPDDSGESSGSGGTSNPDGEDDFVFKDRVRTPDRFIIIPGMSHDYESSETIAIHPPTGDNSIDTIYYIIAAISLLVVVAGIFGIKKYVIKK